MSYGNSNPVLITQVQSFQVEVAQFSRKPALVSHIVGKLALYPGILYTINTSERIGTS